MYRAALEHILGFKLQGNRLRIDPCIPRFWREFEITYRREKTTYRIKVENPHSLNRGVASVELDGQSQRGVEVLLGDDGRMHEVRVVLGEKPPSNDDAQPVEDSVAEEARQE
jgi:cyclic beta-1,2-glucan synthetase